MFSLSDYDYTLPEKLIAQKPADKREYSRLLYLNRANGDFSDHRFCKLNDMLNSDDMLVVNDTKVIPARLFGRKETGGKVEILIINYATAAQHKQSNEKVEFECLVKASKMPKIGTRMDFGTDLQGIVSAVHKRTCTIKFSCDRPFDEILDRLGVMPLPPYIKRAHASDPKWHDKTNYQTVYAKNKGAVAAPTAGLHFSNEMIKRLKEKGISIASITLHVGYGTFMPVQVENICAHQMHSEQFIISEKTADTINRAKAEGRRIVAVGTTSVRTLEYVADEKGHIRSGSGNCDLFIYPGYQFKCIDAMITNFHLPRSTLLMLVSAFAGREHILNAYKAAIEDKFRFYSYGDAMFIE
jgi:S-adenosylmethionine:tRNA ribosyltransferase-isomerase